MQYIDAIIHKGSFGVSPEFCRQLSDSMRTLYLSVCYSEYDPMYGQIVIRMQMSIMQNTCLQASRGYDLALLLLLLLLFF